MGANAVSARRGALRAKLLATLPLLLQISAASELDIADGKLRFGTDARPTSQWARSPARSRPAARCSMARRHSRRATSMKHGSRSTSGFSVQLRRSGRSRNRLLSGPRIYVVTHDAGRALNRMIVDGQVIGAVAGRHRRRDASPK